MLETKQDEILRNKNSEIREKSKNCEIQSCNYEFITIQFWLFSNEIANVNIIQRKKFGLWDVNSELQEKKSELWDRSYFSWSFRNKSLLAFHISHFVAETSFRLLCLYLCVWLERLCKTHWLEVTLQVLMCHQTLVLSASSGVWGGL